MCNCCGIEVLRSGTRWSVWFCDTCKERVREVHSQYRAYLLPVGRHSVMAGFGVTAEEARSASSFRDLDLDRLEEHLRLLKQRILYGALGWFLEQHAEAADDVEPYLRRFERHAPRQPLYLGPRSRGARLQKRWNILVPAHLASDASPEGGPS